MHPSLDFETYSEAGHAWLEDEQKWKAPDGATKRGLEIVGIKNYVNHPSFEILCLAYDLCDGLGPAVWVPGQPPPDRLLDHVRAGRPLYAWNASFEFTVWDNYCVPYLGWPPLKLEQLRCDMAKARAYALPGKLEDAAKALAEPRVSQIVTPAPRSTYVDDDIPF